MNIYRMDYSIHQHFFTAPPGQSEYQNYVLPPTRTRQAVMPAVSFHIFDSLPEYPTVFDMGYSGKLLKSSYDTPVYSVLNRKGAEFAEEFYKSSHFGRAWYLCRGPPDCRCSYPPIDNQEETMFDTRSVYALNKLDKTAIVYPSVTGEDTRLKREDFASEAEFEYWKNWSDDNYHKAETAGWNDSRCLSFEAQRDEPVPSAEEVVLAPYIEAEQRERRRRMLEQIRSHLTKKQYRRLCLYYLEDKTEAEIAVLEGITQQRISKSLISGTKIVERFFQEIFLGRG